MCQVTLQRASWPPCSQCQPAAWGCLHLPHLSLGSTCRCSRDHIISSETTEPQWVSQCHTGAGGSAGIKAPGLRPWFQMLCSPDIMVAVERTLTLRSELLSSNSCHATCRFCDFGQDTQSSQLQFLSLWSKDGNTIKEGLLWGLSENVYKGLDSRKCSLTSPPFWGGVVDWEFYCALELFCIHPRRQLKN